MIDDGSPLPNFITFDPSKLEFAVVTSSELHVGEYRIVLAANFTEFPDEPARTCTAPLTVEGIQGDIVVEIEEEEDIANEEVEEVVPQEVSQNETQPQEAQDSPSLREFFDNRNNRDEAPPEARIRKITQFGVVTIVFSEKMFIPNVENLGIQRLLEAEEAHNKPDYSDMQVFWF